MSRAIRWQISYKSLKDKACRVDIYDEGWTGSITALTPTASPFFVEEDNDEDLLTVIRPRTGYINIYEYEATPMADLVPATGTSHYVEAYYDGNLIFTGYMQPQSFDNVIDGYVREVSFPVVSMLGMLDDYTFNAITTPGFVTLGKLLQEVIAITDTNITYVVMPRLSSSQTVMLDHYLNTLVVSPFNRDYSQLMTGTNGVFAPLTYREFIEGLCNMFGMMVYERPRGNASELIFRRVDFDGNYIRIAVANLAGIGSDYDVLATVTGATTYRMDTFLSWADDSATESLVKPFKRITRDYNGNYYESVEFSFDRLKLSGIPSGYKYFAFLKSETPELTGPKLLNNQSIDSSTYLVNYGVIPMVVAQATGDGSVGSKTKMIAINVDNSWVSGQQLFKMVFMERPTADIFVLKTAASVGDRPYSLVDTYSNENYNLNVIVRVNGQYWDGSAWVGTVPNIPMTLMSSSGALVWRIGSESAPCPDGPVEIIFTYKPPVTTGTPKRLICITEVTLTEAETLWSEYQVDKNTPTVIDNTNGDGIGEETVGVLFSPFRRNYNRLMPVNVWQEPEYPYLMITQQRIVARYKITDPTLLLFTYRPQLAFLQDGDGGEKYRLVATAFNPVDDEVTLTLHHSDNF